MVISVLKFQSRTYEVVPEPTWELAGRIAFLTHHHERNEVSDEPLPSERESNELSDRITSRANYSTIGKAAVGMAKGSGSAGPGAGSAGPGAEGPVSPRSGLPFVHGSTTMGTSATAHITSAACAAQTGVTNSSRMAASLPSQPGAAAPATGLKSPVAPGCKEACSHGSWMSWMTAQGSVRAGANEVSCHGSTRTSASDPI